MNLVLTSIGAGLGYLQTKNAKGALIGAAAGIAADWLLKSNPISQHYTQRRYLRRYKIASHGPKFDLFGNPTRVKY